MINILLGEQSEPHTRVFNRDFAWYIYVSVCLSYVKTDLWHPYYSFRLYARAALAWTKKKLSLINEKLRASDTEEQRKEKLRIRRENEKIENHEKQHLATLKRLKWGDDNELKRNQRLEKVVAGKQLRLVVETEEERRTRMENDAALLKS